MNTPVIDIKLLKKGDRRTLSKAITLVESKKTAHREQAEKLIEEILPLTGKSRRIGISGTPGVGKSTFIEALGLYLINQLNQKVAVLAVDPSSPISGGSIMGDKTRMEELSQNPDSFIRPSPSSGALGGVALKTRESLLLCEAAGFDTIIIETVGVGQSEYEVADMVDFFLLLVLPGGGDEIQGIKKGILELSDTILINKTDGIGQQLAQQTLQHYQNALELFNDKSSWKPLAETCSALENINIDRAWEIVNEFYESQKSSGELKQKRAKQNAKWMRRILWDVMKQKIDSHPEIAKFWQVNENDVLNGLKNPYLAALSIADKIFKN